MEAEEGIGRVLKQFETQWVTDEAVEEEGGHWARKPWGQWWRTLVGEFWRRAGMEKRR